MAAFELEVFNYIELSEYKLYMGHIHTLVLTREWIAMLYSSLLHTNTAIFCQYIFSIYLLQTGKKPTEK